MPKDYKCASCGAQDGNVKVDRIMKLEDVPVIPGRDRETGYGVVTLCTACREGMPVNLGAMVEHARASAESRGCSDEMLERFLLDYMQNVWPSAEPPPWSALVAVLNAVGLTTKTGLPWTYHNLVQKCQAIGVDRAAIMASRASAEADRARALMPAAGAFTVATQGGAAAGFRPEDWQ